MPNQYTHPWTKREIEFLEVSIGKLTYEKIGASIGRSYSSVQSKIRNLPFRKKVKKYKINSNYFTNWTRDMAYIVGFIAADGNICHSGRAHTLHVASDDKDILKKIKQELDYLGPIHQKLRFNGKISYSLRICDRTIFSDLIKLGIVEKKSLVLSPRVNKMFIKDFLRGYFDGDGTVYLRNSESPSRLAVIFYTASLSMAKLIHHNLKRILGDLYRGNIQERLTKFKNPYYSMCLGHKASVKMYGELYSNTNLYMIRKQRKFLEGMSIA